jgi:hypothetical protein
MSTRDEKAKSPRLAKMDQRIIEMAAGSAGLNVEIRPDRVGRCRNKCKGERSPTDSPAMLVTIHPEPGVTAKVAICECCEQPLEYDPVLGAPAIDPAMVEGKHKRYVCRDCNYNLVVLADLRPPS